MSIIGYARVSSNEQNLDRQIDSLKKAGCSKIFLEKVSGKDREGRPELKAMLNYLREGDTLKIESISRLARSTRDFLNIVEELQGKGVQLISSKESIDTTTPTGKFMLVVFSALAEMEREQIRERQREGIISAQARGKHLGRPALVKPGNYETVYADWKAGKITAVQAFNSLGISKASFYRLVKNS